MIRMDSDISGKLNQPPLSRISVINLVIVTKSQHNAGLIERLLSSIRAKTYAIRWAYNVSSLDSLLNVGQPDVVILDATDQGVSRFIDYIEQLPSFATPIIALAKNSQMQSELDTRIPGLVKARIDSSRIGRSLLSRTIRQVVAAAAAEREAGSGNFMEIQGIQINTRRKNRLSLNMLNLNDLCKQALQKVRVMAADKSIHLYNEIEKTPFRILGDATHLAHVLQILLENGIKHTEPNGAVGLELVADPGYESLHITVWDTGPGIHPRRLINLYRADWLSDQVDQERTLRYVQKYVQLHEGLTSIDSDVGKGTRITLSIPWESAVQLSNGHIWQNSFKRMVRILLVEDDDQYIETISSYLLSKNFEVVIARNGEEGLHKVRQTRPDIVLMDIEMPIMGGLEAIRAIRQLEDMELAQIPIIAFTAMTMARDRHNGLSAGADEYITKPVSLRWLSQSITTHLERIHLIDTISS